MDALLQDVRYAVRALTKGPGFTAVALLTMATAIGANTTVFSFVNALLLRPPAGIRDPGSLVSIFTSDYSSGPYGVSSLPDYESVKSDASAFAQLAAYREEGATLIRIGEAAERVRTMAVSGEFFTTVGVRAASGRLVDATDVTAASPPVAVIGHSLWQRAYGGSAAAVGATLTAGGTVYTVVGVAPADFTSLNLGAAFDLWIPLVPPANPDRGSRSTSIVGRLQADFDLAQAQAQLDGIAARLAAAYPTTNRGTLAQPDRPRPIVAVPHSRMHPSFRGQVTMIATVLLAAVGLVLLIACANVAGLLLTRATARHKEIAVRRALGASGGRLLRQMLTESLLLGIAGGALGLLVALWTADVLPSFFPAEQAQLLDARIDWRVLTFTAVVGILSGITFGTAPALQGLKATSVAALRADAARAGDGRGVRLRKLLVMSQVALAAVLLVSAVLLTRSLTNAFNADLGFATKRAVLASLELPAHQDPASGVAYFDEVLRGVGAVPGVDEVAYARSVPVAGISRRGFTVEGYVPRTGEGRELHYNVVSHSFFTTMGIKALQGRLFNESDRTGRRIAIVNHIFAARYFRGSSAVGRHVRDSMGTDLEIVGVVKADRRLDMQDVSLPVVFYLAEQQFTPRMIVIARTSGDPALAADTVRRTIVSIDRDVAVFRTVTLESHLGEALAQNRLIVALVATCGVLALALALIGVYGIVSYTVARRTREIGVRIALGATPWQVVRLLLADNGVVVAVGLVIGMVAAAGAARLLGSMLYGVSSTHASSYGLVLIVVALVAGIACLVPAMRALGVNPVAALRHD
jgi:putative ABC transport system permease protein